MWWFLKDKSEKKQHSRYRDVVTYVWIKDFKVKNNMWQCRVIVPDTSLSVAQIKDIITQNDLLIDVGYDVFFGGRKRMYSDYDRYGMLFNVQLVKWDTKDIKSIDFVGPVRFNDKPIQV